MIKVKRTYLDRLNVKDRLISCIMLRKHVCGFVKKSFVVLERKRLQEERYYHDMLLYNDVKECDIKIVENGIERTEQTV